jgi:hypothetical protein
MGENLSRVILKETNTSFGNGHAKCRSWCSRNIFNTLATVLQVFAHIISAEIQRPTTLR